MSHHRNRTRRSGGEQRSWTAVDIPRRDRQRPV